MHQTRPIAFPEFTGNWTESRELDNTATCCCAMHHKAARISLIADPAADNVRRARFTYTDDTIEVERMSQLPTAATRSAAQRALDSLKRGQRRSLAIRELRAMARWRLSDLGISADQIPAFVDALLERQEHGTARIAPTKVQATHTQWLLGPWAEELADP
jgi:uncharacterized protein YjiS (DUF1127 family)